MLDHPCGRSTQLTVRLDGPQDMLPGSAAQSCLVRRFGYYLIGWCVDASAVPPGQLMKRGNYLIYYYRVSAV